MNQVETNRTDIQRLARDVKLSRASRVFGIFHTILFLLAFIGLWVVSNVASNPHTFIRWFVEHIAAAGVGTSAVLLYYRIKLVRR